MARPPAPPEPAPQAPDPLAGFRNWPGFFWATLALNLLFVYGMLGNVADPAQAIWFKTLVWVPFNAIASAVYLILAIKLSPRRGGAFYIGLCAIMAVANWLVMFLAGPGAAAPA